MFEGVQYCGYVCLKGSHGIDLEHDHEEKDSLLPSSKEKSAKQEGFASSISINTHPQLSSNSEMIAKTIQQTHKTVDNSAIMPPAATTPKKSMLLICERMTMFSCKTATTLQAIEFERREEAYSSFFLSLGQTSKQINSKEFENYKIDAKQ